MTDTLGLFWIPKYVSSEADMDQAVMSSMADFRVVFVGGEAFPEESLRRARAMVQGLLVEADAPKGEYQFRIKGSFPLLKD